MSRDDEGSATRRRVVWTVVVGGGSGQRFGRMKQFETLGDRTVIDWAVDAALAVSDGVVVVVPDGAQPLVVPRPGMTVVAGGSTRSESVRCGLARVPAGASVICVHDAARPFADPALFSAVIERVVAGAPAAIPGVPVTDTIKVIDDQGVVVATPDRATLVGVQTPQAFRSEVLRAAHGGGGDATDDAALVEARGEPVVVVPGSVVNRKITHLADLAWARRVAAREEES